jgi:hypothetical protein
MRHVVSVALLLAAVSVPASAVTVEAATGDWSKLPQLDQKGYSHLDEKMQAKLYEIAGSQKCPSFKLVQDRLDLRLSFAVKYAPDGTLDRVILPELNCGEAAGVIGGTLLAMLQGGDYAASGKSANGWYQGTLGFSFAGENAREASVSQLKQQQVATAAGGAVKGVDPNEILCERVEAIGTRLSAARTCMTRAQWAEQKRLTRQDIEKLQTQRPCKDTC